MGAADGLGGQSLLHEGAAEGLYGQSYRAFESQCFDDGLRVRARARDLVNYMGSQQLLLTHCELMGQSRRRAVGRHPNFSGPRTMMKSALGVMLLASRSFPLPNQQWDAESWRSLTRTQTFGLATQRMRKCVRSLRTRCETFTGRTVWRG